MFRIFLVALVLATLLWASNEVQAVDSSRRVNLFPQSATLDLPSAKWKARKTENILAYVEGVETKFTSDLVGYAFSGQGSVDTLFGTRTCRAYVPLSLFPDEGSVEIEYSWYVSPRGTTGENSSIKFRPESNARNHIHVTVTVGRKEFRANTYLVMMSAEKTVGEKTSFEVEGAIAPVDGAPMVMAKKVSFSLNVEKSDSSSTGSDVRVTAGPISSGFSAGQAHAESTGKSVVLEETSDGKTLMTAARQRAIKVVSVTKRHISKDGTCDLDTFITKEDSGIVITVQKFQAKGGKFQWQK